jgi:hypothetical protein
MNEADLTSLFDKQNQIASRAQLLAVGVQDSAMTRHVRRGDWQRVVPGVYALDGSSLSVEQRRTVAALYAGEQAQLTGATALHWYGFRYVPSTDKVHVLVPHNTRKRSAGVVVVQRTLCLDSRPRDGGLYQLASPARAAMDASRAATDLRTVRAILAEAVQGGFAGLTALNAELRRAKRSRTALASRVITELAEGVRSTAEADLRDLTRTSGLLPPILWNPQLIAEDGTVLPTPDGYLPVVGIAFEVDSREHHATDDGWKRTLDRGNLMARYGVIVLHITPADIRSQPAQVLRLIEHTYAERCAHPVEVSIRAPC